MTKFARYKWHAVGQYEGDERPILVDSFTASTLNEAKDYMISRHPNLLGFVLLWGGDGYEYEPKPGPIVWTRTISKGRFS